MSVIYYQGPAPRMPVRIEFFVRHVYGVPKIYPYPGNVPAAQFAALLGVKTFSNAQLTQFEAMGYDLEARQDPATVRQAVHS